MAGRSEQNCRKLFVKQRGGTVSRGQRRRERGAAAGKDFDDFLSAAREAEKRPKSGQEGAGSQLLKQSESRGS